MAAEPGAQLPLPDFGQMRTAAADRERAIDVLKAAFAEGRLDMDEYTDRVGQAHTSKTYAELAALTADLPVGPLGTLPVPAAQVPAVLPVQPPVPTVNAHVAAPPERSGISVLAVMSLILALFGAYAPAAGNLAGLPAALLGLFALPATTGGRKHGRILAIIGIVIGTVAFLRVG